VTQTHTEQGGHKPGKPGIFIYVSEHGKLMEFCATSGNKYNNKNSFSAIEYLHETTVDWVNRIIMISGSSDPAQ